MEGKGLSSNDYTDEEKTKLGGVEANANNYTLPDASASVKGGVTVGTNVDVSGGKISVKNGTTSQKGVVQLSNATDDTSTTKAATPSAVKAAYDLAAGKQSPATSLAGYGIADAYTKDEVDAKMSSALEYKGSRTPMQTCPPPATRKAMCGTSSTLMRTQGSTPVTMWPGMAPHGMCWPVRWT
ncbi:MAG: phage tail protein [Evtepia gabavorous]